MKRPGDRASGEGVARGSRPPGLRGGGTVGPGPGAESRGVPVPFKFTGGPLSCGHRRSVHRLSGVDGTGPPAFGLRPGKG